MTLTLPPERFSRTMKPIFDHGSMGAPISGIPRTGKISLPEMEKFRRSVWAKAKWKLSLVPQMSEPAAALVHVAVALSYPASPGRQTLPRSPWCVNTGPLKT